MKNKSKLFAVPLAVLVPLAVHAQVPPDAAARTNAEQQQQVEQRRDAQQRAATVAAPVVRSTAPAAGEYPVLPDETPCFRINTFTVDVPDTLPEVARVKGASALPMDPFAFLHDWLRHYEGQCVGKQGLDLLTKGLQGVILSRGYVTTRVLLPTQDLSKGTLKFSLVPGVIRNLEFADADTRGTLKSAFPTRDGNVLQLRDLEQGLEQMKRVPNQDAAMQIVPGASPGESDVVVTVKRTKPWSLVVSADNSGTRETGGYLGSVTLGLYNLLGLNDVLSGGYNQDLQFGNHSLGTHGWNASYSVPWGYWTGTLYGYTNTYYQQIAGVNQTFVSSGNAQTAGLKLERVFYRSQSDKSGIELQLIKRFGASFIEDTEIPQQYRDNTFIEAGLTNRHYFGAAQFDGTLAYRQGIGALGAMRDSSDGPTYYFHLAMLDANLSVPFALAGQMLRYVGTLHGQFTNDQLNYIDDLTIGSRYTVRGFSGETMLAAEKGFYWRNELQYPLGQSGQVLYAGIDYGHLWGPSTAYLAGTQLSGAAIGLKGSISTGLGTYGYDVFAGTPIYAPSDFPASRITLGFQFTGQF
ncbi:ShlB/FhaC/HecB family hemolysin secretion/activation protein [Paraburkholderia tropica]|uniref:Hemolysin activation/secretion protein n=1 Tax=Paraburkholderia tropica TaxID=92647 RepID=A0ABX5MEI4_9BURK|nr:ShlB/FhaC/HecB family hemolysin secretion/activation protein [Paraburkholderia tropica]MDE1142904.1 ShlB/FhaC/HecB family hemolysin secretion/activation protein [Paraburkholderia tropica]PXX07611.1 hemolysin activation/secretion protein [Paraburkholderia tropica]PZW73089.1 hemolysin activation/secretion protein [Paraburkholderia tropica]